MCGNLYKMKDRLRHNNTQNFWSREQKFEGRKSKGAKSDTDENRRE